MTMFPCSMIGTKFNIKQNNIIKLSFLLTEIIQIKKRTVEALSFSHVYNIILIMQGIVSKHSLISFKYILKLYILNKCCPMLHKFVETGKTNDKCNNLLNHSCYACYQDYLFSFFVKLDMLITSISVITIGTDMLGTIFGMEFLGLKRTSVFIVKTRNNTYINFSFLNVNHKK